MTHISTIASNSAETYAKFWDDESTESLILSLQEQVQPLIVVPPEQVQSFPVIITSGQHLIDIRLSMLEPHSLTRYCL